MNIIIGSEGFLGSNLNKLLPNVLPINSKEYINFISNFSYVNKKIFICADAKNNSKIININL